MKSIRRFFGREDTAEERERMARLKQAERYLCELQDRGNKATSALTARRSRNHWREAIEQMIHGAV